MNTGVTASLALSIANKEDLPTSIRLVSFILTKTGVKTYIYKEDGCLTILVRTSN